MTFLIGLQGLPKGQLPGQALVQFPERIVVLMLLSAANPMPESG